MSDTAATVLERALLRYRTEARFRATVQSVVAQAMQKHGRVDPHRADHEAHDIATEVGAILLQTIYDEDAELNGLAHERDHFRAIAEQVLLASPHPLRLVNKAAT